MRALIPSLVLLAGCFDFSQLRPLGDGGTSIDAGFDGAQPADAGGDQAGPQRQWFCTMGHGLEDLNGVWGTDDGQVYAVGGKGNIFYTNDDGDLWNQIMAATTVRLNGVAGNGEDVFAVGQSGTILHGNGKGFTVEAAGTANDLSAAWVSTAGEAFAVGLGGTILHRAAGLSMWTSLTSPTSYPLYGIWATSPNNLYVVGSMGLILHTSDGKSFATQNAAGKTLWGVWGPPAAIPVHAVGGSGIDLSNAVLHSDDGVTWVGDGALAMGPFYGISGNAQEAWAVGYQGAAFHYFGGKWSQSMFTNLSLIGVWESTAGEVFAVGKAGLICRRK